MSKKSAIVLLHCSQKLLNLTEFHNLLTVNFPWKILCNADTCVETCTCAGRILVTWLVQYLPSCVLEIQTRRGIYWAFHIWKVYSLCCYRTDASFAYFSSVSVLKISYGSYILQVFPYFKSVVINILWKSNVGFV